MTQPILWAPRPVIRINSGPYRAMHDGLQATATSGQRDLAKALINCYAVPAPQGPMVVGFPGFSVLGGQLGASSTRTVQRITQFTKRAGTEYTVAICGGKFYTYDWGGAAWTEVIDSTDLSGASITLDTSALVSTVTFADKLIVSDGVNTPWAWDGTTHGGLTKLTNAPVLYGPMVVYYAKLFGIKNSARQTMVWSEEGDPTIGYDTAPYSNAWDIVQTATEGLTALAATNEALFYFRDHTIGAVTGAVTSSFQTTGTREAVSERLGTKSPWSVTVIRNSVYFVDQHGQPSKAIVGQAEEICDGYRQFVSTLNTTAYAAIQSAILGTEDHLYLGVPVAGNSVPSAWLTINTVTDDPIGIRQGFLCTAMGIVKNSNGVETVVHGGGNAATVATGANAGYVYAHGSTIGTVWDDGFVAASQPISHTVQSGELGYDEHIDKQWTRWDATLLMYTSIASLSVSLTTPREASGVRTVLGPQLVGGTWDAEDWAPDDSSAGMAWAGGTAVKHVDAGFERSGRSCVVTLTHGAAGERFALLEMALEAQPLDQRPGIG